MACTEPGCVHDHIKAWLRGPVLTEAKTGYMCFAPCHDDKKRSLVVSAGKHGGIVWYCHACTKRLGKEAAQIRTRHALIKDGVPARCLPLTRAQVDSMVDQFREILHADVSQVEKVYRLAALTECGELPHGAELDALAEWCGVSRRAAYNATRAAGRPRLATPDHL
jgi:hypothetical protein